MCSLLMRREILLKRSPFLVVRQISDNEVRLYSKLNGNLTTFGPEIHDVLGIFDHACSAQTAAERISGVCRCDPAALIGELYEKHFLVEEGGNESDIFSEYVARARQRNAIAKISKVTFLISAQCNLACRGCYHGFYEFKSAHMDASFAHRVFEGLFPYLKKRGVPALLVSFLGYEPLLNFETMKEICDEACRLGTEYGIETSFRIFTNAFVVSDEIYEWIGLNTSRLSFKVSLDGIREDNDKRRVDHAGKGTYDRVVGNLKKIIATGVECGVITVLSKLNLANIDKFVDEMAAIGTKNITANIFCGQSENERKMELTESEKFEAIRRMDMATEKHGIEFDGEWKFAVVQMITGAQFTCPAGIRQMVFCADGAIHPCQRFAGTRINFGTYEEDFWEKLGEGRCESYNSWTADLYDGVMERTREDHADLTGWSCPFVPFIRGECLSKNVEGELNERLLEYYITRPMNRIIAKSRMQC